MRANLDVAAGPNAHGDGGTVALEEHGDDSGELNVAQALGQVTVLIVDVAHHVDVAGKVAASKDDALGSRETAVGAVGAIEDDNGNNATVGILLEVLSMAVEQPLCAVPLGVGLHPRHDLVPAPLGKRHVGVAEDDGTQIILVAGGVHDDAVIGRAARDVQLMLVHPILAHLLDDVLQELAGVVDVGLDDALVGAALVATIDLTHEVLRVDLGGAVGKGPGVVDRADLAADVHVGLFLLRLHNSSGQTVLGGVLGGPGTGLATADDDDVERTTISDLILGNRLGSGLPSGCCLRLPAVGRRCGRSLFRSLLSKGGCGGDTGQGGRGRGAGNKRAAGACSGVRARHCYFPSAMTCFQPGRPRAAWL